MKIIRLKTNHENDILVELKAQDGNKVIIVIYTYGLIRRLINNDEIELNKRQLKIIYTAFYNEAYSSTRTIDSKILNNGLALLNYAIPFHND